ncbi:unnamed protein product, partial [Didymodactylos carnosus]
FFFYFIELLVMEHSPTTSQNDSTDINYHLSLLTNNYQSKRKRSNSPINNVSNIGTLLLSSVKSEAASNDDKDIGDDNKSMKQSDTEQYQTIEDACIKKYPEMPADRIQKTVRNAVKVRKSNGPLDNKKQQTATTNPNLINQNNTSLISDSLRYTKLSDHSNDNDLQNMLDARLTSIINNASETDGVKSNKKLRNIHPSPNNNKNDIMHTSSSKNAITVGSSPSPSLNLDSDFLRHAFPQSFRPPDLTSYFSGGNSVFRPSFLQSTAPHPLHTVISSHSLTNGSQLPETSNIKSYSASKLKLNNVETGSLKTLVSAYREAATYLFRSADELETLITQQS